MSIISIRLPDEASRQLDALAAATGRRSTVLAEQAGFRAHVNGC